MMKRNIFYLVGGWIRGVRMVPGHQHSHYKLQPAEVHWEGYDGMTEAEVCEFTESEGSEEFA